jgi:hypothetical protein
VFTFYTTPKGEIIGDYYLKKCENISKFAYQSLSTKGKVDPVLN